MIQTIADKVGHLTVFVRTPQYILPMKNPKYTPEDQEAYKSRFEWLAKRLPHTFTGFEHDFEHVWAELDAGAAARRAGGDLGGRFAEVLARVVRRTLLRCRRSARQVSEFVREKMRARLKDPRLCDILIPKDYGFGTHRVPLENGFLEAFLRPNVEVVSVKDNRIERVTPNGLQLADGTEHAFDVLIFATGFDALIGGCRSVERRPALSSRNSVSAQAWDTGRNVCLQTRRTQDGRWLRGGSRGVIAMGPFSNRVPLVNSFLPVLTRFEGNFRRPMQIKIRDFSNNRTQRSVDGMSSRPSRRVVEVKPRSCKAGRRRRRA